MATAYPRQLAAIEVHAKQHGFNIVRTFGEEGVIGARETMGRLAWQEMMTALHSDGVRTIVIEKLDRLARSLLIQDAPLLSWPSRPSRWFPSASRS